MLGNSQDYIDYWSILDSAKYMRRQMYEFTKTNPNYFSHIQFDANQDMIHHQARTQTMLTIFFWLGGWFAFMYAIGTFIAS